MLLEGFEKYQSIKLIGAQLESLELENATIKSIDKDADALIENRLKGFVKSLTKDYLKPADWKNGRDKELAIELEKHLRALADRIRGGYRLEGSVKELPAPEPEDQEDTPEMTETRAQIVEIQQLTENLKHLALERQETPILPSPENDEKDGDEKPSD